MVSPNHQELMKKLLVLLSLFLATSAIAEPKVSVSLGSTFANTQPSGIWWQQEYSSKFTHNAPSFTLRVDNRISNGWSYGVGYAYVGNFHSDSLAVSSDPAYASGSPWPLSRWIGNQKVDGIFLVGRKTIGKWYIEAGPMLTKTSYSMDVPDWIGSKDWPTNLVPDTGNTRFLHVGTPRQMKVELIGGVGYNISDKLSVQFTAYPTRVLNPQPEEVGESADTGPGILKGYSGNLSVLYTF
jgi:hypothetical protein